MKTATWITIGLVAFGHVFDAGAEEQISRNEFDKFRDLFIGDEWTYHTKMTDESGQITYEGSDVRMFSSGMRGNYLIENAFSVENGERIHLAVQLTGFDRKTGHVHLAQYWPWQATKLGDVEAELRFLKNGLVGLIGTARPADQEFPAIDVSCEFIDRDTYECVSFTSTQQGTKYKSNHEVFNRNR